MIIPVNSDTALDFNYDLKYFVDEFSNDSFNDDYLKYIMDKTEKVCHVMNNQILKNEMTTLIFYIDSSIKKNGKEITILLFAVHPELRKYGYGNLAMTEFIQYLKSDGIVSNFDSRIVLHALKTSVPFYKRFGFTNIKPTSFLKEHDIFEDSSDEKRCFAFIIL